MARHSTTWAGVLGFLALLPAVAGAQQNAVRPDTLPDYLLQGVLVTTTRTPAVRHDLPQRVEVVTRAEVERTPGDDLADVLKRNAAVDVIQYPGLLSGVSVRGFRPQFSGINSRTLILVDGRPAGATNLATLDVAAVERVEVLKGPASALYGSNAMGGVINVITRTTTGPVTGAVTGSYGSFDRYRGSLTMGGSVTDQLDFDLALAGAGRGEGYRTGSNRALGAGPVVKTVPGSGERLELEERTADTTVAFSRYSTRSGTLRVGYSPAERWTVTARGGFFEADDVQNAGDLTSSFPFPSLNDLQRRTGEVGVVGALGAQVLSARVYGSRETTAYYDDAAEPSFISFRSPTRWYGAQLQDVIAVGAHRVTVGMDYSAAEAESESFSAPGTPRAPFNPNSGIYSAAAFAEARLDLLDERLVATLGGRLDRVSFEVRETALLESARAGEDEHTVFNPSAGLLYRLGGGVRLHATAGRAFVTPDAFNVAGYVERGVFGRRAVRVTRGNPSLVPESSVTWDAGVSLVRPGSGLEADLTYFRTDVRDRITTVPVTMSGVQLTAAGDTVVAITSYQNADRSEIRGVEARVGYDLGARAGLDYSLRLFADATRLLEAREINAGTPSDITHVADVTANFGVEYDDRRLVGRLAGRYVGERTAPDYNDWQTVSYLRYPEFLVLDLFASLRLAQRYRLTLEVENLADESYYEVRGYDLPGRGLRAGAEVTF